MSKTARTPLAPWKYASLKSCRKVRLPMMSKIIMSTWTGRPCIEPNATDFFDTTAPRVRIYDSSNAPDTNRRMRLVLPTPSSPTRQILNLKVFESGSIVGLRSMVGRDTQPGVIKPSARFSESGMHRLESFDIRDRPRPPVPRLEPRLHGQPRAGQLRRDEEAMKEATANPFEGHERPDLRVRQLRAGPVDVGHRHRRDPPGLGDVDIFGELRETIFAEHARGEIVELAHRAPGSQHPALVAQCDEEPLPRDARRVDVVRLDVPLPVAELPCVGRSIEERHRSPSRRGRK